MRTRLGSLIKLLRHSVLTGTKNPIDLGNAARDIRDWAAAIESYSEALSINENNAPIWVQYGHALKEYGRVQEAEAAYRRAISLTPNEPDSHLQLGHALKLLGQTRDAGSSYANALRIDPKFEHARNELRSLGWSEHDLEFLTKSDQLVDELIIPPNLSILPDAKSYIKTFTDVEFLIRAGIFSSVDQHYSLYGYREGREILLSLSVKAPARAIILCPSFFKKCGIGEHSRYLADCIEASGLETIRIRTTRDLAKLERDVLKDAVLIVNHGPGLFDGYNPELSEGESTIDLISTLKGQFVLNNLRPIIFMHSLLNQENSVMFPRQQMILESSIPVVTTIEGAARTFGILRLEHGMQPIKVPTIANEPAYSRDRPVIGFFGFYQWGGKNFEALFNVASSLQAKIVGSVATRESAQVQQLSSLLNERNIICDIGTGWVEEDELVQRLAEADYYYLPQHDYDHWNNSGTARLVMNFHKPVIVPPHSPFLDLRDYAIFADENDLPALLAHMRDDQVYQSACKRSLDYANQHSMVSEMPRLVSQLHEVASETGAAKFLTENAFSVLSLLALSANAFVARISCRIESKRLTFVGEPNSQERLKTIEAICKANPSLIPQTFSVVEEIKYWRRHYEISDFIFRSSHDVIFSACRCLLKRDPNFRDYETCKAILGARLTLSERPNAGRILELLAFLSVQRIDLEFAPNVQLFYEGKLVGLNDLRSRELIDHVKERVELEDGILSKMNRPLVFQWNEGHYNLLTLIMLPSEFIEAAFNACSAMGGFNVKFDGLAKSHDPLSRYVSAADLASKQGSRISDIFIIDAPIVRPINHFRSMYCAAEFWALEGDAFVTNLVRAIMKRDPTPFELFAYGNVLEGGGKLSTIQAISNMPNAIATLVDVENANPNLLDQMYNQIKLLMKQFRSVHAGGWQQRNRYLEAKRDFGRFWQKSKQQKDIWWQQAGDEIAIVVRDNVQSQL